MWPTPSYQRSPWCANVLIAASDATKVIKAAPGSGLKLVVTKWSYRSITAAAQLMSLTDGTITIENFPVSITAGNLVEGPKLEVGVAMTANTALSLTPAAAGPSGRLIAEGYIDAA